MVWDQTARVWFDEPDAAERLARRASTLSRDLAEWSSRWIEDGYFVVENVVESQLIDAVVQDVSDIWTEETPREYLLINRVNMPDGEFRPAVKHSEILAFPPDVRDTIRQQSNYTLGDCHHASPAVRAVFDHPRINAICSAILDGPAETRASLYFDKGSEQNIHQDAAVFGVYPRNTFIGVWIALEDISADCGALVYYPKSHREPMYREFDNYPQTSLRQGVYRADGSLDPEIFKRYDAHLAEAALRYERKLATIKKGSALFWHPMLIHGGSKVERPGATRHSLVLHVMKQGCDVTAKMVGPFHW